MSNQPNDILRILSPRPSGAEIAGLLIDRAAERYWMTLSSVPAAWDDLQSRTKASVRFQIAGLLAGALEDLGDVYTHVALFAIAMEFKTIAEYVRVEAANIIIPRAPDHE